MNGRSGPFEKDEVFTTTIIVYRRRVTMIIRIGAVGNV